LPVAEEEVARVQAFSVATPAVLPVAAALMESIFRQIGS